MNSYNMPSIIPVLYINNTMCWSLASGIKEPNVPHTSADVEMVGDSEADLKDSSDTDNFGNTHAKMIIWNIYISQLL